MQSLQAGELCFIVGHKPDTMGYPHNNKVVKLVNITLLSESERCWSTEPEMYTFRKRDGVNVRVIFAENHLKPFPKDLLKDEQEDKAPLKETVT